MNKNEKVNGVERSLGAPVPKEKTDDFKNMLDLLALYSAAENQLKRLTAGANDDVLEILEEAKAEYAENQKAMMEAEAALEVIARRHPEWFREKQSIKTPYGTPKFHNSTELLIPNEEATLAKLELLEERSYRDASQPEVFKAAAFIRTRKELDKEALEKLEDATLAQIGVKRVLKSNFSIKAATLDLGKATKEAAEPKKEAA